MKIAFFSNFLNHHQLPFAQELIKLVGEDNYKFVATNPFNQSVVSLGYEDMNKKYPWVIRAYESKDQKKIAKRIANEFDVVIIGAAPVSYIRKRALKKKLTFRYSERIYKTGFHKLKSVKHRIGMFINHKVLQNKNMFLLCASAYAAYDYSLTNNYVGRTYKWGYFPETKEHDIEKLIENKPKDKLELLWCARFIDLKHPEKAIAVAERLKADGYNFILKMIGTGEMFDEISKLVKEKDLDEHVKMLGSMPSAEVRTHMESANIFLFTSDFNEGWGAVLNEAMNSGCAIVASHAIGAVPFLIKNGENGLIYKNDDFEDLYNNVRFFTDNDAERERCGKNAYSTIIYEWSAEIAPKRLVQLIQNLQQVMRINVKSGPCSIAHILNNEWYISEEI
ncbi:MAG: glycosyltransferase family 4 protein [Bacillota bacterium]